MKLYATIQLFCHPAQALQPSVESWFELCPRRHTHLNTSESVQGLYETREDNLTIQAVIETLDKVSPSQSQNKQTP